MHLNKGTTIAVLVAFFIVLALVSDPLTAAYASGILGLLIAAASGAYTAMVALDHWTLEHLPRGRH